MPVNAGPEYAAAEAEYTKAKSSQEKIKALERMYSLAPKHKSSEGLLRDIKTKISKLRAKAEKDRAKKSSSFSVNVKKEGAAQVALVGLPNSGKSYILNRLTGAKAEIADYPFTTKMPEVGVMDYHGVKIQIVEIPAFFDGFMESGNGPALMGVARSADLIAIILDGTRDCHEDLETIKNEFEKAFVKLKKIKDSDRQAANCILAVNKVIQNFKTKYVSCWAEDIKECIWKNLNLIYVQTKQHGKKPDLPPVALKKGSTIKKLANLVHKDFVKNFKYARIWGKSVKHDGSTAGLDHVLAEGDVVEIHTK